MNNLITKFFTRKHNSHVQERNAKSELAIEVHKLLNRDLPTEIFDFKLEQLLARYLMVKGVKPVEDNLNEGLPIPNEGKNDKLQDNQETKHLLTNADTLQTVKDCPKDKTMSGLATKLTKLANSDLPQELFGVKLDQLLEEHKKVDKICMEAEEKLDGVGKPAGKISFLVVGKQQHRLVGKDAELFDGVLYWDNLLKQEQERLLPQFSEETTALLEVKPSSLFRVSKHYSTLVDELDGGKDRTLSYILLKAVEEIGELSQDLTIHNGDSYKDREIHIVEEAVDTILCLLDLIHRYDSEVTEQDLAKIAETKCQKWITCVKGNVK